MPVGATATAVASICDSNPSFALKATIITHILAPLTVPLIIWAVAGQYIEFDILNMLKTLLITIFAPSILYFLFVEKRPSWKKWVTNEAQFYSIVLTGIMIAVVVALQRHFFFSDITLVSYSVIIGCILYFCFYACAWFFPTVKSIQDKKAFAICSGVNNIALSAGLAALYFSPLTVLFRALGEIPWVLSVAAFKKISQKFK
jgi:BASS family bile acid:Na+ symporter